MHREVKKSSWARIVKISRLCCPSFLLLLLIVWLDQTLAARSVEQPICSLEFVIFFLLEGNFS